MPDVAQPPGAALVVLRRLRTSTDVMVVPSDGNLGLPHRAGCAEHSQSALAEALLRESGVGPEAPLYASSLTLFDAGAPLGVFVSFLDPVETSAPPRADGHWMDLRQACREMAPRWSEALSEVRSRFVARSPDESFRIR